MSSRDAPAIGPRWCTLPKLSPLKARQVISAFKRLGFKERKNKSGHTILVRDGCTLSVPVSHGAVKTGTLHGLIGAAGITAEEFLEALKKQQKG